MWVFPILLFIVFPALLVAKLAGLLVVAWWVVFFPVVLALGLFAALFFLLLWLAGAH